MKWHLQLVGLISAIALLWMLVIVAVNNVNLQILGFSVATYLPLRIAFREG